MSSRERLENEKGLWPQIGPRFSNQQVPSQFCDHIGQSFVGGSALFLLHLDPQYGHRVVADQFGNPVHRNAGIQQRG
jgi:hypothetical protein